MALYSPSEVEAKQAKPSTAYSIIRDLLKCEDEKYWDEIERFLMPPGIGGSRSFDQAYAVGVLLEADKNNGKFLHTLMIEKHMSRRLLWDYLQRVLKDMGFRMKSGRLVGISYDEREKVEEDNGQPDID